MVAQNLTNFTLQEHDREVKQILLINVPGSRFSPRLAYNLYFFPEIFETRQRDMKKSEQLFIPSTFSTYPSFSKCVGNFTMIKFFMVHLASFIYSPYGKYIQVTIIFFIFFFLLSKI